MSQTGESPCSDGARRVRPTLAQHSHATQRLPVSCYRGGYVRAREQLLPRFEHESEAKPWPAYRRMRCADRRRMALSNAAPRGACRGGIETRADRSRLVTDEHHASVPSSASDAPGRVVRRRPPGERLARTSVPFPSRSPSLVTMAHFDLGGLHCPDTSGLVTMLEGLFVPPSSRTLSDVRAPARRPVSVRARSPSSPLSASRHLLAGPCRIT